MKLPSLEEETDSKEDKVANKEILKEKLRSKILHIKQQLKDIVTGGKGD